MVDMLFHEIIAKANARAPADGEHLESDGMLHCDICGDAVQCRISFLGNEKIVRCVCSCIKKQMDAEKHRRLLEEYERNRLTCFQGSSEMLSWTFSNDDLRNKRMSDAMRKYVEGFTGFQQDGKGLLMYGPNGRGKTFYAACIANALIDAGRRVLVTTFTSLAEAMQGMYEGKQEYLQGLSVYDLIVFDDLGAERGSDFMQEQVFKIVNARYCSGLPFIVTTNLTIDELTKPQDFGRARIYSRILERCFPVEIDGIDRRKSALKKDYPAMAAKLGLVV